MFLTQGCFLCAWAMLASVRFSMVPDSQCDLHTLAFSKVMPGGQKPPNLRNRLVPATLVFLTTMNLYVGLNSSVHMPALGGDSPANLRIFIVTEHVSIDECLRCRTSTR